MSLEKSGEAVIGESENRVFGDLGMCLSLHQRQGNGRCFLFQSRCIVVLDVV